jgi:hypothetical protein
MHVRLAYQQTVLFFQNKPDNNNQSSHFSLRTNQHKQLATSQANSLLLQNLFGRVPARRSQSGGATCSFFYSADGKTAPTL